ncbi:uncharacterized protein ARMOST_08728 [Armillaria ostoyae]|uniref:Heterokaryon incompatibility domain-containing protein n=1 Tax=Armillaria ostoyae TaxID=47428 RepID=A0A284R9E5_ARMOS|nr:uncharacterized protein ARMOST_08728 [Armillaria ostoyae]
MLPKSLEDDLAGPTGQLPEVTISSQTEIGQTEESVKVPNQRAYTGRKPVISSSLADTPCSSLGIQGLLDLLNATLRTSYTLDISLSSALKDCIAKNYDFGTAYGRLRSAWYKQHRSIIQIELWKREAEDINRRRNALDGSRIVDRRPKPRRVWDLCSNRVVPWWSHRETEGWAETEQLQPISHAWVDEKDRVDMWTPINGYEWPVPIPKGAKLDLIRIEMLNLGVEYTWLDVLCLRQRGGPREDLRVEEWKLDVPTIGAIYQFQWHVVCYFSGLGLPLSLKEGDLESDRCWFRRVWTAQEVGLQRMIQAGDTPDGPMHAKPKDHAGNYKDEILTRFHKQLRSKYYSDGPSATRPYDVLSMMQDRISTNPVDRVAGLAFLLQTHSIPAYYESQSLEDAWTALIQEMPPNYCGQLFFTYLEPGTACKKWRPSWEQVMTKSLPNGSDCYAHIEMGDDNWWEGSHIERGFVRGLAVGGAEGINRCGELVVEDANRMAHAFNIIASHQYLIPEDTYTLLGNKPVWKEGRKVNSALQYWVVGRRLPSKMFEKVSVFKMTDSNEIKQLEELGLSIKSRSILA